MDECPGHSHAQTQNHAYDGYCPVHELDWTECCDCCIERRRRLRQLDRDYRNYWRAEGLFFRDRKRP